MKGLELSLDFCTGKEFFLTAVSDINFFRNLSEMR